MFMENGPMEIEHTLGQWALDDRFLYERMSFICGPRQIGKTTLAQRHLEIVRQSENYHNWDSIALRQKFATNPFFFIENVSVPLSPVRALPNEKRQWRRR